MTTGIRKITIPFRQPKQQHRIWQNGKKVLDNQIGEDKKLFLNVRYVVKSDVWWDKQSVTDKQGKVWITDVFEYGEYYVIMMTNGSKIQVVHDRDANWHIV